MDRKKVLKRMIGTICIIGLLVIGYKCIISGHSMPIFSENAISEYRIVALGGEEQSILIRGKNKNNPILLYLHGGPGNPETSFVVPYQKKWEEQFTVVNWDQRGSGRSYNDAVDTLTLTTEQICSDAIELTHYLKKEFDVEKIYLVGHSYGTYVGMRCIESNPEDFYAYVGIGQVGNQQKNENYLICYAMEMAEKDGNTEALDELEELGELPYQKDDFGRKISLSRKWTTYYGGQIYDEKNGNRFIVESILRPEYNVFDLVKFLKADALYYTNTEKDQARWELFQARLEEEVPYVEVPVYFIQGTSDYITSYQSCQEYFEVLEAPYKQLIPIEGCAHNPVLEATEVVNDILINKVKQ